MSNPGQQKGWLRKLVEFALDEEVNLEMEQQRRRLAAHPGSAQAHFNLAVLYYSQRRAGEAIAEFEAAIACEPTFASAHRKLGEVYVHLGDYQRAGRCALAAAELGDRTLLEMFARYPRMKSFVERPEPKPGSSPLPGEVKAAISSPANRQAGEALTEDGWNELASSQPTPSDSN
jgi:tetratricopeptide (TPR) repeat protein